MIYFGKIFQTFFLKTASSFFQPLNLCDIEQATSVVVSKEDELSQKIEVQLKDPDKEVRKKEISNRGKSGPKCFTTLDLVKIAFLIEL